MRETPEYQVWRDMLKRCHDVKCPAFKDYGARGISVCERWRESFVDFFTDMGARPPGLTIERNDNDGNYEPSNCRWATKKEQRDNQRIRKIYKNNRFGVAGISLRHGKFRVVMGGVRNRLYLGETNDFFEACCLRKSAESKSVKEI